MSANVNDLEQFVNWTLSIRKGDSKEITLPQDMVACTIPKNSKENPNAEQQAMSRFVDEIFPDITTNIVNPGWLEGRCILATTNKEVDMINDMVQSRLPGNSDRLPSADTLENNGDLLRINEEYLHTLMPNGFPEHVLRLKPGMPCSWLQTVRW